jgi:hypothetical protein
MSQPFRIARFARVLGSAVAAPVLVVALAGCEEPPTVRTYAVSRKIENENERILADWRAKINESEPKRATGSESAGQKVPGRLLAALVPHGGQTWTFKLLGDAEAVGRHAADVRKFVEAVAFERDQPKWTLPPNWRMKTPPGDMRFATLLVGDENPPLELAVSILPGGQDVAANVNRWRGQMGLPPQSAAEAEKSAATLTTPAGPARWVDVAGEYDPKASMAPFAAMAGGMNRPSGELPAGHPPLPNIPSVPPAAMSPDDLPVRFQVPAGWRPSPPPQFAVAAFTVGDENEEAVVSVSSASGGLLPNVNRWRSQLGLPEVDENALDTLATKMKVAGRDGTLVEIIGLARLGGEQKATYVVMVDEAPGTTWFIKMTGDATVAFREREKFLSFAQSLKFVEP